MHEPLLSSAAKDAVGSQDPLACCSRTMACNRSVGDRGGTKGAAAGPADTPEEPEEIEGAHSRSTTRDRLSASVGAGAQNRSAMVAVVVVVGG